MSRMYLASYQVKRRIKYGGPDRGITTRYTKADNSVVVATDSIKNTIYILAKQNPVTPPELFASIVGDHFTQKYSHIRVAHVNVVAQLSLIHI